MEMQRYAVKRLVSACILSLALGSALTTVTFGQEKQTLDRYPTAIMLFQERGSDVSGLGVKVTDLLYAQLAGSDQLMLVDRQQLSSILEEQELTLTGIVGPDQAVQVGKLTGAKLLVTGSVMSTNSKLIIVGKALGVETSRVAATTHSAPRNDDLEEVVAALADKLKAEIAKGDQLVLPSEPRDQFLEKMRTQLVDSSKPSLSVKVPERHVGITTSDPAAETELLFICRGVGLEITENPADADINIIGEGLSEFAGRHGNLVSVRARVELRAVERESGKILAADRQTSIAIGASEEIAGKSALEEAARSIAGRMLPQITASKSK